MPLFCSGVNEAHYKKLVPITRKNGGYIVPEKRGIMRESFTVGADKRQLWVLPEICASLKESRFGYGS